MGLGFSKELSARTTAIPGLQLVELPVYGDNRGWFKENWQREKMLAAGLPDFRPVQNNISFNGRSGTTRGIHAEPWDKFVSVATGRIFGAWVDLRAGPTFGKVFTVELDASRAVFVPRGVGNAFQTLEDGTAYSYLVNDHWSEEAGSEYTFLNLADEDVKISWPIPLEAAEMSDKDRDHPRLADVVPMPPRKILVLGANGQVGKALRKELAELPHVAFATRHELDLADPESLKKLRWRSYGTIINAAAYTAVDEAESLEGRGAAWAVNVTGTGTLAKLCAEHNLTLVHLSSDYVFDGRLDAYTEDAAVSPLGVYGQTKAAGDALVSTVPKHYIVRTSWVIGEGNNFVRTMARLAAQGVSPTVVEDQIGRLSFAEDIAAGVRHLLETRPAYGTYNLTNCGAPQSWADIARRVYELTGRDPADVVGLTTAEYFKNKIAAPRPRNSVLELGKIQSTGFTPEDADVRLKAYLAS
jgi:dTDP-4-dehydrorhamnose 3,5-epimerase/reductase